MRATSRGQYLPAWKPRAGITSNRLDLSQVLSADLRGKAERLTYSAREPVSRLFMVLNWINESTSKDCLPVVREGFQKLTPVEEVKRDALLTRPAQARLRPQNGSMWILSTGTAGRHYKLLTGRNK
jgi:hypothetical protein